MSGGPPLELPAAIQALALRLAPSERRRIDTPARRAAVLVPLLDLAGEPSVLFTLRSRDVPTHKGQVSFPGGMVAPGDASPEHTALRETREEIGVPPDAVRPLGLYHDALAVTGVIVTPVVGWLGHWPDLSSVRPCAREIADVFAISLADLRDPGQRAMRHDPRGTYPVFTAGPHPVWGLTAFILAELLDP